MEERKRVVLVSGSVSRGFLARSPFKSTEIIEDKRFTEYPFSSPVEVKESPPCDVGCGNKLNW